MRLIPLLPFLLMTVFPAAAEVYSWTDEQKVTHYTDTPPSKNAKPVALPRLQTYKPSTSVSPAASDSSDPDTAARVAAPQISIAAPQAGETIRDGEGKISLVISADLQPGQGLIYSLDGTAQNSEPTLSTGYLYTGVERGEHQLGAAVVGADGRELAHAAVTVFVMPSVIRRR